MPKPQLILIQGTKPRIEAEKQDAELRALWNRMIKDFLDKRDARLALGDKAPPERLNAAILQVPEIHLCCFK